MSVIANLDINLRGNTKGFDTSMGAATGRLGALKQSAMSATPAIGLTSTAMGALGAISSAASIGISAATAALAAFGGAAIAAGSALLAGGLKQMTDLDSLGKAADRIGMSTEALAGFRHAAGLAGVETDTLQKSLMKMQRNLSEAAAGGGAAARALADLGLDAAVLKNIRPAEAFQQIAEKINEIPNAADKAAVSMEIFGKSGADMINLIAESGELGERIKEAAELGLSATRSQIAEVEAANDAWDTMKSAITGVFRTVSISIAPFVQMLSEGMTEAIKSLTAWRDAIVRVFRQGQFVLQNFPEYVNLYFDKALLAVVSWSNDLENIFTNVVPTTFMEGVHLITPAWDYLTGYIAYSMVRITNIIVEKAKLWGNVIDRAVHFDLGGTKDAIADAIAGGKERQEGAIEAILRQDSERSAKKLDRLMGDAAKKIGESFNRAGGPIEQAMRQAVESKAKGLAGRMEAFTDAAMSKLKVSKKKSIGEEDEFQRSGKGRELDNAAVERGSQQALKLITNKQEDKTVKAINGVKDEAKRQTELLKKIAGKPGIARANV